MAAVIENDTQGLGIAFVPKLEVHEPEGLAVNRLTKYSLFDKYLFSLIQNGLCFLRPRPSNESLGIIAVFLCHFGMNLKELQ